MSGCTAPSKTKSRPHEALALQPPAGLYTPSPRCPPRRLEPIHYSESWTVRKVQKHGEFYWGGDPVFLGEALVSQPVGLQLLEPGYYHVFFTHVPLAIFEQARSRILTPAQARRWEKQRGRWKVKTVNHVIGLKCKPCVRPDTSVTQGSETLGFRPESLQDSPIS